MPARASSLRAHHRRRPTPGRRRRRAPWLRLRLDSYSCNKPAARRCLLESDSANTPYSRSNYYTAVDLLHRRCTALNCHTRCLCRPWSGCQGLQTGRPPRDGQLRQLEGRQLEGRHWKSHAPWSTRRAMPSAWHRPETAPSCSRQRGPVSCVERRGRAVCTAVRTAEAFNLSQNTFL